MALGPKDFTNKRKQEFAYLEELIDMYIDRQRDETPVQIPKGCLPSLDYHFSKLKELYLKAGWKKFTIECDIGPRENYKWLELTS